MGERVTGEPSACLTRYICPLLVLNPGRSYLKKLSKHDKLLNILLHLLIPGICFSLSGEHTGFSSNPQEAKGQPAQANQRGIPLLDITIAKITHKSV